MTSEKKKAYLEGLKALQTADTEAATTQATEPVERIKIDKPVVERIEAPKVEKTEPVVAEAAPVVAATELFPGFNNLDPELQKTIAARYAAADEVEKSRREKAEFEQRLRQAQDRVGPTQQQLAKVQADFSKLQQQVNDGKVAQSNQSRDALLAKINELRDKFPEDASMWDAMRAEAIEARETAEATKREVAALRSERAIEAEVAKLNRADPEWQNKRAKIVVEDGRQVVRAAVETEDAKELEVWANALDPYERQLLWPMLGSRSADDAIYFLKRFEQDRAQARASALAGNDQHAVNQTEAAPLAQRANPVADPDPSRRATAPSVSKTAGQPMTDKKREFLATVEMARREGKLPPTQQRRRA